MLFWSRQIIFPDHLAALGVRENDLPHTISWHVCSYSGIAYRYVSFIVISWVDRNMKNYSCISFYRPSQLMLSSVSWSLKEVVTWRIPVTWLNRLLVDKMALMLQQVNRQQSSEDFLKLDGYVACGIAMNVSIGTNDLIWMIFPLVDPKTSLYSMGGDKSNPISAIIVVKFTFTVASRHLW